MIYAKVISILYKTSGKGKEMGVSGTYNAFLYTTTLVMATSKKKLYVEGLYVCYAAPSKEIYYDSYNCRGYHILVDNTTSAAVRKYMMNDIHSLFSQNKKKGIFFYSFLEKRI